MDFKVGSRVLADIVVAPGVTSREAVLIERVLDQETVLVAVEASVATPVVLIGLRLPIPTARIAGPLGFGL